MRHLHIHDLTVRDGNQSLLATRMERDDILTLVEALDKVGFNALEVWGGATFDSALRFLKTSPWENLRKIREAAPKTRLSMLLRGQNIVGYRHYDNDTLERFIRLTIENGIDIIRCFDALNDPQNVKNAFKFIKKHGGEVQAALSYTMSPVHNLDYYVELVKTYESLGADSICIKDMAGILLPEDAYPLVQAIKATTKLPLVLHSHATAGSTQIVMYEAMRAGVDAVEGCISPFSGGTAHLADESLLQCAKIAGRETSLDEAALSHAYDLANGIADKYIASGQYKARNLIPNPKILSYQVPGGMLSNLLSQLEQQKAAHRLDEVLQEVPRVRKDLGYPPLVTPLSQMVGTQAVLNVLLGERYKMSPKEIKDYCQGFYGKTPAPLDEAVVEKILKGVERQKPSKIIDLPSEFKATQADFETAIGRPATEEERIAYVLFPQQAVDFYKAPEAAATSETVTASTPAAPAPEAPAATDAEPIRFRVYLN